MTTVLQIGDRTLAAEDILPLLASYKLIPQLICENIIDQAIESIHCSMEETTQACQEFYQKWELVSEIQRKIWQTHYGLSQKQVELLATRRLRVEKFKLTTWGHKIESYFLTRKKQLDQVIYSIIQIQNREIANELYFRLREGEQSFAEIARQYSQGPEAYTGGLTGPVELGKIHQVLAELLYISQIWRVQPPVCIGKWQVIVRLEKLIPAQLNDSMRKRLLQEKFEAWFQEQLRRLPRQEQIWMGIGLNSSTNTVGSIAA